ncbi:hypothetical protein ACFRMQ_40790, partial [Kitasatospora sp. NPDC056783]
PPLRPAAATAPAEPHAPSSASAERHCGAGEAAAPAQRPARSASTPSPAPAAAPAEDRTVPATAPTTGPTAAAGCVTRPRVPLLVTGRWRI